MNGVNQETHELLRVLLTNEGGTQAHYREYKLGSDKLTYL